ncbi:MAG: hypothetical protein LAO20_12755 [Acidobacteriia bacterium]|nr:hypothetical protein [Terriglobia bacterium]
MSIRKPVCLFVALLLGSAPLLACALPGQEMTSAEQDCCLHMSDQCGSAQMADAHSCCTKTPGVATSPLQATSKYTPAAPQAMLAPVPSFMSAGVAGVLPGPQNTPDGSPSPPGSISVLRI